MRTPGVPLVTGVLVALALSVSACSGTGSEPTEAAAKGGGTITYGIAGGGLTQLDPNKVSSAALLPVMSLLYNGLTRYGPDMSTEPDLATSWKPSADHKTWTFELRENVRFHDGKEFTADDAVANIERVLDEKTASQARGRLTTIDKATAVDPHTLRIELTAANALLPTSLIGVYMSDVDGIAAVNEKANGTGPYKLKDFVPDDHLTLVRNPKFSGTKGKLDQIDVVVTADSTSAVNSLRNRELDVVWNVPPLDIAGMKDDTSLSVLEPDVYSGAVVWELDTTSAPFDDVRARKALAHAVNREQMLAAGYDGLGVEAATNSLVSPKQDAYDKTQATYDFDLQKAKRLFAQAGVKEGSTLTFWTTAGRNAQWSTMGEILQQDLKKIGITLKIEKHEISTWLQKFFPAGKKYPGVIVANYLSVPSEPSRQLNFFKSGVCECNWSNAGYDRLLAQSQAATDESQRNGIYAKMQQLVNDEVPLVVPLTTTQLTVAQKRVVGAWVQSDGAVHLEEAGVSE